MQRVQNSLKIRKMSWVEVKRFRSCGEKAWRKRTLPAVKPGCGVARWAVQATYYYIDTMITIKMEREVIADWCYPHGRQKLLALLRTTHDLFHRISRRFAMVQNGIYLGRDGALNLVLAGDRGQGPRGPYAFGDHACTSDYLHQSASFAEFNPQLAIAAKGAGTRQHQVAQACESAQGFSAGTKGHGQAGHFRQTTGDQRGDCIGTQPQTLASSRADSHHIFHRACQLDADPIVVGVQAEGRAGEFPLNIISDAFDSVILFNWGPALGCHNHRGGIAARGFQRA